jgi:hypothetical protein
MIVGSGRPCRPVRGRGRIVVVAPASGLRAPAPLERTIVEVVSVAAVFVVLMSMLRLGRPAVRPVNDDAEPGLVLEMAATVGS